MLNGSSTPEVTVVSSPPPSYTSTENEDDIIPEMPPAYEVASKLPSYEEAEMSKPSNSRLETGDLHNQEDYRVKLGTDSLFALCFFVSFIFNWIGFIFAYCVTDTIAGRYGALSGFGLSLIKWVFILKHSKCCKDLSFEDAWLWWLFALLGWLVFIRGILVYAQVKKTVRAGQAIYIPRYWGLMRNE
ncbi:NEDD4 family-interacting protein 1-like isoform X2 [Xenia sp. Carnegie-2017]|nr:NEDD4 family-interacting protein 1-like isoform X2 [Xenia sp. Carnegie-2017]